MTSNDRQPIVVEIDRRDHRALRQLALDRDCSMAELVRNEISRLVESSGVLDKVGAA